MSINESVGKEAIAEPKKFIDNLIFRDAKHFVAYFLKKGFSLTGKGGKLLFKKPYKLVRKSLTGRYSSELKNKDFLKSTGNRQVRSHFAYEIAGLSDNDLAKVKIEDVKKSLSKYNIEYTLLKNSYTGEIKFKMQTKDYHIFDEVREDLLKKIRKGKTMGNKRHSLASLYKHREGNSQDNLFKEKMRVSGLGKDKNKDIGLGR